MLPGNGQAGALSQAEKIEAILREEISLAGHDGLEFLQFQVPDIAARIADHLGLLGGPRV